MYWSYSADPGEIDTAIHEIDAKIDYLDRLLATIEEITLPQWLFDRLVSPPHRTYRGRKATANASNRVVIRYSSGFADSRAEIQSWAILILAWSAAAKHSWIFDVIAGLS
jgi:hypothetical protein